MKYPLNTEQIALLETRFTYHAPHDDQPGRFIALRVKALELAELIVGSCPNGREQSLALTNLDQAIMWANAAIARGEA
jgi:hypothetical protein